MRSHDSYKQFIRNYWNYYLELENEFLSTRKYVDFGKENFKTYSIEFLKLYLAVCGEVDTIGKAMACEIKPVKDPSKNYGNITKWWHTVQDSYQFWKKTGYVFNDDGNLSCNGISLKDVHLKLLDEFEIIPWFGFEPERSSSPPWWKAYNTVKHKRSFPNVENSDISNFSKANLKNLSYAFGGLYVLEKSYMESLGTMDDLDAFFDESQLFSHKSVITRSYIKQSLI